MKNIWWNQVTNAVKYVADIKKSLLEEKNILLKYATGMPWRDQFVTSVKEAVKLQNGDKKFIEISNVDNPGEYLLQAICKSEKRAEYRPSKGYARFFAESDDIVLHDRYVWVRIDNEGMLEEWTDFVADYFKYREKQENRAVFILECFCEISLCVKKGIKFYSFDDYIGDYDRIVFAMLASSSIRILPFLKKYLAELVANVAGNDIELAAECVLDNEAFLKDPSAFMKAIVDEKRRSNGSAFVYTKDADEISHLIWLSQIKTIYPYLEEYREDFVQRNYRDISKQLPIQASYGEKYEDPKDVELGTLMYMAGNGIITMNTVEYNKLKKFKEARNKLSHLTALSIGEIEELL